MLRKLIVFAITSGLASKAYRALMNRQRGATVARGATPRTGQPVPPRQPNR